MGEGEEGKGGMGMYVCMILGVSDDEWVGKGGGGVCVG